jgi:alkylhydroperoxidase family enzyme
MPRIAPIALEQAGDLREVLEGSQARMGFLPNSQRILAHRPEILRAFRQLADAVQGPSATIDRSLRNLLAQMASRAAGCAYCMAHTAHSAARSGIY